MLCSTINLRRHLINSDGSTPLTNQFPLRLSYGFLMDAVQSLRNMTRLSNGATGSSYRPGQTLESSTNQSRDQSEVANSPLFGTKSDDVGIARHLLVFPDPEFDKFANVKKFYHTKNDYLTINVSNHDLPDLLTNPWRPGVAGELRQMPLLWWLSSAMYSNGHTDWSVHSLMLSAKIHKITYQPIHFVTTVIP